MARSKVPNRSVCFVSAAALGVCMVLGCGGRATILDDAPPAGSVAGGAGGSPASGGLTGTGGMRAMPPSGGGPEGGGAFGTGGGTSGASSGGGRAGAEQSVGGGAAGGGAGGGGEAGAPGEAGAAGARATNCCSAHPGLGCDDPTLSQCVCGGNAMFAGDPFCCTSQWDSQCAYDVEHFKCGHCPI